MKKIIITVAALFGMAIAANAQEAGSFLDINGDTRGAAMGDISTALDASAFSVFNNAAAAPLSDKKFQVGVSYSPWAKQLTDGLDKNNTFVNAGIYYTIGEKHSILAGFRYLQTPESTGFDDQGNPVKSTFEPKDMAIDLGYAYRFIDNMSVSLTARYISSKLGDGAKADGVAFDLGLMYRLGLGKSNASNLDLAFKASNFGSKLKYATDSYELPGKISLGAMFSTMFGDVHSLKAGLDLGYKVLGQSCFAGGVGAEYMAFNTIAARVGYHFGDEDKGAFNYATVGIGVRVIDMIQADFSYDIAGDECPLKNTYRIALSFRF